MRTTIRLRTAVGPAALVCGATLLLVSGCGGSSGTVTAAPLTAASGTAASGAAARPAPADTTAAASDDDPCSRVSEKTVSDVMGVTVGDGHVEPMLSPDGCLYVVTGSAPDRPASVFVQVSKAGVDEYDLSRTVYGPGKDLEGVGEKAFVATNSRGGHGPTVEAYGHGTHYRIWVEEGPTNPFPADVGARTVALMKVLVAG